MEMFNPPHPGEVISEIYLLPFGLSARAIAHDLQVDPSTFSRVIAGKSAISPDMAIRLSKVLGGSPESWLQMQTSYDLWQAKQQNPHSELRKKSFATV
jgi:addiction module HigA family antidote